MPCDQVQSITVPSIDISKLRLANTNRLFQRGLEYWFQFALRTRYDAQNVRCCCLLLQGRAQVSRALAQFIQQPRVLDGDNRLRGKARQQGNMFLLERPDLGSANHDGAKRSALLDQRYGNDTAMTRLTSNFLAARQIVPSVLQVVDVERSHFANGSTRDRGAV